MGWKKLEAKKFACIRELNGISRADHGRALRAVQGLHRQDQRDPGEARQRRPRVAPTRSTATCARCASTCRSRPAASRTTRSTSRTWAARAAAPAAGPMELIKRDFPSYDAWLADFKASGLAARGWVWLAYDHDWNVLTTVVGDAQNTFPLWNATPILALDVYEHAYWIDYGRARAKYIEAFFNNLDWTRGRAESRARARHAGGSQVGRCVSIGTAGSVPDAGLPTGARRRFRRMHGHQPAAGDRQARAGFHPALDHRREHLAQAVQGQEDGHPLLLSQGRDAGVHPRGVRLPRPLRRVREATTS